MLAFLKTAAILLLCLMLADLVGVIVCLVFDVAPLRGSSSALPYAIWFVLGVFSGFIALNGAGGWIAGTGDADWSERPEARRTATSALVCGTILLAALSLLFWRMFWSRGVIGGYYVPDSMSHTLTFFVAVLGAMTLARTLIGPKPGAPAP